MAVSTEGSIPFTHSNKINGFMSFHDFSATLVPKLLRFRRIEGYGIGAEMSRVYLISAFISSSRSVSNLI
jgi:hypothetical protein